MTLSDQTARVVVDGKFFRLRGQKFFPKGVTYGPFAPDPDGNTFPPPARVAEDFRLVRELNANLVRVYYVPPRWLMDLAEEYGLKLLVDIPWEKHRCFLETHEMREAARACVRAAAAACAGHPAVFALSVANEIPAEIVRWHGADRVGAFLDELVEEVKQIDPQMLCTFASFPPTEYLRPRTIDFITFNVYLHSRNAFDSYLARLQTLANEKPLVLGEFGVDSTREGERRQGELLAWQLELAFRGGVAGTVVFSFTDDWWRGGEQISDWTFGLTTRERVPKPSFHVVREHYELAPYFPGPRTPKVSVVVASYNGAATLRTCLESLNRLNYPDYEVILVDDGSTDSTPQIAAEFPSVRNIRQDNRGLSVARNTGIAAARGEVIAFTDSDCRADEDWLFYMVGDLLRSDFAGIGGHNFLPPEDSPVAAAVLVSPGGPAHVMLSDREAEHIPGCNMAFYKWALETLQGFDPVFRKAGDDVDVCWRLQEAGFRIGFSPAGFVWHYRRSTVKAYLKQQAGYGEAEAMLAEKHPEYFNDLGGGVWRGRIYAAAQAGVVLRAPVIYHGIFGSGFFQRIYGREASLALMLCTSPQFHAFVTLPLLAISGWFPEMASVAIAALLFSVATCVVAAWQTDVPPDRKRFWTRPLVALLFLAQPIVRGCARYKQRLNPTLGTRRTRNLAPGAGVDRELIGYWSKGPIDRYAFLARVQTHVAANGWPHKWDSGWDNFDLDVTINRWSTTCLITASEELSRGRRFIRCHIKSAWSWSSMALVGTMAMLSLALALLFAERQPYAWFLLASVPFIAILLEDRRRLPVFALSHAIDSAATELGLERYDVEKRD